MTANRCPTLTQWCQLMTVRFLSSRAVYSHPAAAMLAVAAMFLATLARGADEAADDEKMSDTWSRTVQVADPPDAKFGEWHFWVQDGWLMGERTSGDGEMEWKIVLARVVGDDMPQIAVNRPSGRVVRGGSQGRAPLPGPTGPIPGGLRFSYHGGRYFIRDDFGSLRCLREPKTDDVAWPEMQLPPRDPKAKRGEMRAPQLGPVTSDGWIVAHAGPQRPLDKIVADCLLRLAHEDLEESGGVKGTFRPGVRRLTFGEWFVVDDGELLVAERLETHNLQNEINRRAQIQRIVAAAEARRKLPGSPPPELTGETWLNADEPPTWESLKGNVVLLVLFDLQQPKFAPLVAPLLGFEETYGKQGLRVIGVYAKGPRDEIEKRLAETQIKFPVLIDGGQTADRYGLDYFGSVLIDREGKVATAYKDSLAPPAEIEKLLGKEEVDGRQ